MDSNVPNFELYGNVHVFPIFHYLIDVVLQGVRPKLDGIPIKYAEMLQLCWHNIPAQRAGFNVLSEWYVRNELAFEITRQ